LENGAFSQDEFGGFAKNVVLFAHITTRIPDEPNEGLFRAVGARGFPTIKYMDAEGDVIGGHQGPRTVEGFQASLNDVKTLVALRAKENPTPADRARILISEIGLGLKDYDEAKQARAALGEIPPDETKKLDAVFVDLEVKDLMNPPPRSREAVVEIGGKFREMAKAGKVPSELFTAYRFWAFQLEWAGANKDVAVAEAAVGALKKLAEQNDQMKRMVPRLEQVLEKIKAEAGK
jgi:hypothetical protein